MKIENQIAALTSHYKGMIEKAESARDVARRILDKVEGRTVRVIEVDRATGMVKEIIRGGSSPHEVNRATLAVARAESEIAGLVERRDMAIRSIESEAEARSRREAARRARDAFAISCIEEGIEDFTAEVG
jgi:hypothetical protein